MFGVMKLANDPSTKMGSFLRIITYWMGFFHTIQWEK